jgi:hypothetical protein
LRVGAGLIARENGRVTQCRVINSEFIQNAV